MSDKVKFDPGMGDLAVDFNGFINEVYSRMMSFRTIHQKKACFKFYLSKIKTYMMNNIAFYCGCLLWAYYISSENKNSPKDIEGNSFLYLTEEQKNDYDFMVQVSFMENYFDSFERDVLYYTGKKILIPREWRNILSLYSEFLELNKGFINTKTTNDIILPEKLSTMKFNQNINDLIKNAVEKKDLQLLLNTENFGVTA